MLFVCEVSFHLQNFFLKEDTAFLLQFDELIFSLDTLLYTKSDNKYIYIPI